MNHLRWTIFTALSVAAIAAVISSCGEKQSLPTDLPPPDYIGSARGTTYVPITPAWRSAGGIDFAGPKDIIIGYDRYLYVCDTKNHRVIKLGLDGSFIESYAVPGPVSVTQDRGLDLLTVAGDYHTTEIIDDKLDTTWYGGSVFRRRYFSGGDFEVVWTAPSPYYLWHNQAGGQDIWLEAEFWGIVASKETDKQYYLADWLKDRIIRFGPDDQPLDYFVESGIDIGRTNMPSDLHTYEIIGQQYMVYAQGAANLGIQVVSLANGIPVFSDTLNLPEMVRFSARRRKDVVTDELLNYYVLIDRPDPLLGKHYHIYKYNRYGEFLLSFGTEGSGDDEFNRPSGIAYRDGVLYLADTDNNRIVRYQLSTDTQQ